MMMMVSSPAIPKWGEPGLLREGLENDTYRLTHTLSTDHFAQSKPKRPATSRIPAPFPTPSRIKPPTTALPVRTRTKSTPLAPVLTKDTQTLIKAGHRGLPSSQIPVPRHKPDPANGTKPSRIPTRARSNSASAIGRSPPKTMTPPMPTQSAITMAKARSSSPSKPRFPVLSTRTNPDRDSIELTDSTTKEGFIKNELPPFKLGVDEAFDMVNDENQMKRRRVETMRNEVGSRQPSIGIGQPRSRLASTGMSNSASSIGLGQPSRRSASSSDTKPRSTSKTSPSTGFPRSASAAHALSSTSSTPNSSRFIAAHLVPPDQTYTPPKGADWDDVVLPTVAKKLGLDSPRTQDGDLAVEWDKEGRAIKWVKREARQGTPPSYRYDQTRNTDSGSSFSPTFDLSPENPLRRPSHSPSPSPLPHTDLELGPLRTTSGAAPSLRVYDSAIPFPAPISDPRPQTIRHQPSHSSMHEQRTPPRPPIPTITVQSSTPVGALYPPFREEDNVYEPPKVQKDGHGKGCGCVIM